MIFVNIIFITTFTVLLAEANEKLTTYMRNRKY